MSRKPKIIILDSWSVIAYLEDEVSSKKVADIIADAHENIIPLAMCVVNVSEVWYIIARGTSEYDADKSIRELMELGIKFVDVDWALARNAATYKMKYKMSFADCFACALAERMKGHLVTGDMEFKQVEDGIPVIWTHN